MYRAINELEHTMELWFISYPLSYQSCDVHCGRARNPSRIVEITLQVYPVPSSLALVEIKLKLTYDPCLELDGMLTVN